MIVSANVSISKDDLMKLIGENFSKNSANKTIRVKNISPDEKTETIDTGIGSFEERTFNGVFVNIEFEVDAGLGLE